MVTFEEIKWFVWYLITEPFIQVRNSALHLFKGRRFEGSDTNYMWIFSLIIVVAVLKENKVLAQIACALLIATHVSWEWKRGFFKHRMRERWKKRLEEKK